MPKNFTPEQIATFAVELPKLRLEKKMSWIAIARQFHTMHTDLRRHGVTVLGLDPRLEGHWKPGDPVCEKHRRQKERNARKLGVRAEARCAMPSDDRIPLPPGHPISWDVISCEAWPGLMPVIVEGRVRVAFEPMRLAA